MKALGLLFLALGGGPQSRTPADPDGLIVETCERAMGRPLLGEWETFILEVNNRGGRDVEATLRLEDEGESTLVSRRETFPRGTRKRLFFYLPSGRIGSWNLRPKYLITDQSGQKLASGLARESPSRAAQDAYQIALFSSDRSSDRAFGFPRTIGSLETQVSRLEAGNFPDRWIGLAALDALIVHDAPLEELSADQAGALADYVRHGGTVILSPGPNRSWLSHPVLGAFCRILEDDLQERRELEGLTRVFGRFKSEDPLVYHRLRNGLPLGDSAPPTPEILQIPAGFGRAVVIPFDVRRSPVESWPGLENLWAWVISKVPRRFHDSSDPGPLNFEDSDRRLSLFRGIASLINPYPPFGLLVALVVVFLVSVGPANYLLLRKLRMTLLIVVTVPAISLMFLCLVLGVGYVLKGTSTLTYTASLLRTRSGLECAREKTYFTLFSPSTRSYDIRPEPGVYGLPLDRLFQGMEHYGYARSRDRGAAADALRLEEDARISFQGVSVGQWQTWSLEGTSLRSLGGGIRFSVRGETLLVKNGTPYPISRGSYCVSAEKGFSSPFGEVPAGKSAEFPIVAKGIDPILDLGLDRESLGGRILQIGAVHLSPLGGLAGGPARTPRRWLLCVLAPGTQPLRISSPSSGGSRSITLLEVSEGAP